MIAIPGWLEAVLELLLGLALFAGGIAFVGWLLLRIGGDWVDRTQARLKREQSGAARYGWTPGVDKDAMLNSAGCQAFSKDGRLRRMLVGEYEGRRIRMAEFLYRGGGKIPSTVVTNLVAIELPALLPDLIVGPDAVIDLGMLRYESESETFTRQYEAASMDHRYSSAMLHPRMMEWLLAHPELNIQIFGPLVVAFAPGPWTVPRTLATLPALSGVVDRIPPFVYTEFGKPRP